MKGYVLLLFLSLGALQRIGANLADFTQYASVTDFFKSQADNKTFLRLYEEHMKLFQDDKSSSKASPGAKFTCQTMQVPLGATTVHNLTPMDVKVIAALGDSITAGTGITSKTIVGDLISERGLSWSIGGEQNIDSVETLANMLKKFNPNLVGYSTGSGPRFWEPTSHLNVALPGAKSKDMCGQAKMLVKRMKGESNIDYENDWKVITIFIGGKDLCRFCKDKMKYGADTYKANLQKALDYLHAEVPRTFVNLVEILNIPIVKNLNKNLICDVFHWFSCKCAAFPANSEAEIEMMAESKKYRDVLEELIATGRYDTRDDFTVIMQPFFANTYPPKKSDGEPDYSYFAADCFHLSLKGHAAAADALWNNMVEPVGKKRVDWKVGEKIECLTASQPYFYTYKNSQPSFKSSPSFEKEADAPTDATRGLGSPYHKFYKVINDNMTVEKSNKSEDDQSVSIATTTGIAIVSLIAAVIVAGIGIAMIRKRRQRATYRKILDPVAIQ